MFPRFFLHRRVLFLTYARFGRKETPGGAFGRNS